MKKTYCDKCGKESIAWTLKEFRVMKDGSPPPVVMGYTAFATFTVSLRESSPVTASVPDLCEKCFTELIVAAVSKDCHKDASVLSSQCVRGDHGACVAGTCGCGCHSVFDCELAKKLLNTTPLSRERKPEEGHAESYWVPTVKSENGTNPPCFAVAEWKHGDKTTHRISTSIHDAMRFKTAEDCWAWCGRVAADQEDSWRVCVVPLVFHPTVFHPTQHGFHVK